MNRLEQDGEDTLNRILTCHDRCTVNAKLVFRRKGRQSQRKELSFFKTTPDHHEEKVGFIWMKGHSMPVGGTRNHSDIFIY